MSKDDDHLTRVANDGPITILAGVGAFGVAGIFALLVSQGLVGPQELDRVGPVVIVLVVTAFMLLFSFLVRSVFAILPRRSVAGLTVPIRHDVLPPSKRES